MLVMPANCTGPKVAGLEALAPGRLANLLSPGGFRRVPRPFAADNGAYTAFVRRRPFDGPAYLDHLRRCVEFGRPLWVAVPDVVADRAATLAAWREWESVVRRSAPGVPLAFVAQDGMRSADVPTGAEVVFVGGSYTWKWRTLRYWCERFRRVHVGRVNSPARLWECEDAGAESCDGTGWFRGDRRQLAGLVSYLRGERPRRHPTLC